MRIRTPRARTLPLVAATALIALGVTQPGHGDDRDLLQFKNANPYLFILLDSSSSMNLGFGASAVALPGDGDNPASRIYAAKEALYSVFRDVNDVNFGFAVMNQDEVRVEAKHWIYTNTTPLATITDWPSELTWPAAATEPAGGFGRSHLNSLRDPVTVGRFFNQGAMSATPVVVDLDSERLKANRFPLLGENANATTKLSLTENGVTYVVTLTAPGGSFGDPTLTVNVEVANAASPDVVLATGSLTFRRVVPYVMVDGPPVWGSTGVGDEAEPVPGFWGEGGVKQSASCDNTKPHTGNGWEGNWDSLSPAEVAANPKVGGNGSNKDRYCQVDTNGVQKCEPIRPMAETAFSTFGHPLDYGDLIPFSWSSPYKDRLLARLAPGLGAPDVADFGVGSYISDIRNPTQPRVYPATSTPRPLIAVGQTPLAKAILEFRCWYMGAKDGNKARCGEWFLDDGWQDVACANDSDWGCRRPFLIIISDGQDTCKGNAPTSEVAGMLRESRVRTWALNLGDPRNCTSSAGKNSLFSITNAGGGNGGSQCVNVASREELLETLADILNQIKEEARAFASAAVPSVQAVADQAIYLTNFTPINGEPIWKGQVKGFAKPVHLVAGKPDDTTKQWDTGELLTSSSSITNAEGHILEGQYSVSGGNAVSTNTADNFAGDSKNKRRVSYARAPGDASNWADDGRALVLPTDVSGTPRDPETGAAGDPVTPTDVQNMDAEGAAWLDLGKALGLLTQVRTWGTGNATDLSDAEKASLARQARDILHFVFVRKQAEVTNPETNVTEPVEYVFGDVFHSDPIVIGQPINSTYLQQDVEGDAIGQTPATPCQLQESSSTNRGYRCFFDRHQRRRQLLLVGANDGMLHGINIGQYRHDGDDNVGDGAGQFEKNRYDHGTGNEIFAYMPRAVMPTVAELSTSSFHQYTVDGPIAGADVFIDPLHDGVPTEADRLWRTVAMGTLREGGSALFALDLTQPDKLRSVDGQMMPEYGTSYVPTCMGASYDASKCGPVPFATPLWEFEDTHYNSALPNDADPIGAPLWMDEDGNLARDLGETWSKPVIGRIRVCDGVGDCGIHVKDDPSLGGVIDKYVAVFGGGLDPEEKLAPTRGNFLYMVDMETGKTLLKRQVTGAIPAEVAAIDVNQDGYLDRVYVGTTQGFLYRMDLLDFHQPDPDSPQVVRFPTLETQENVTTLDANGGPGTVIDVVRVAELHEDGAAVWPMRLIFDAGASVTDAGGTTTVKPRPIYFRPAVIVAQVEGGLAVAFGTGDREDLWSRDSVPGRFYLFLDQTGTMDDIDLPLNDDDFTRIEKDAVAITDNLLINPGAGKERGWYLELAANERVITSGFSLVGITFFATYQPDVGLTDANGEPIAGELGCASGQGGDGGGGNVDPYCSKTGTSNLYLVNATNGNPLMVVDGGDPQRYKTIGNFVTTPFSEFTAGSQAGGDDPDAPPTADDMSTDEEAILELLKSLFPANCRFVNARIQISTVASDTSIHKLASVPICLASSGWKEF